MLDDVILLDGGMGQELYKRGLKGDEMLWSANALITAPEVVKQVHMEFIAAGAQVITTNTYSTKPGRLRRVGLDDQIEPLNRIACDMAMRARDEAGGADIKIAASIPPQYSYRPDIEIDTDEMRREYEEMVALLEPHVDLFLCETMTDAREARAAAEACAKTGKPVWCAWTFKDDASGLLRSDDRVQDAIQDMHDIKIDAFLANCCAPESVSEVMPQMQKAIDPMNSERDAQAREILFGGYANGFTPIPPKWKPGKIAELSVRRNLSPEIYADFTMEWVKSGASIIGGCCEISPDHIKAIHTALGR